MTKYKIGALLASTAAMGIAMSPVERRMGRLMRAPDAHPTPTPAPAAEKDPIEAMMDDDGVEGQWGGEEPEKGKKAAPKKEAPSAKEAVDEGDDEEDDDAEEGAESDEETDEDDGEEKPKPGKKSAKERIQDLNRQLREERRGRAADKAANDARLDRLEKLLSGDEKVDKKEERVKPDPNDKDKYPFGALDDRYVEDMIEFRTAEGLDKIMTGHLQRQQEEDQQAESNRILKEMTAKADVLTEKGAELFDDFIETVVEPAKAGEFPLTEATFEACAEAYHGAAILRDLALDVKEAEKVAAMSPYQQLRYVMDKDAEKGGKPKPKLPKAGAPPADAPRGARGKFEVADDTDDLEAFGRKFDKA